MEEWPDDHLDELFRKSAEEFDVPFNTDDWADLSRRLDKHDRQTVFDRISRWGGIGALVLLLLGGFGWVMYDEKPTGSHQRTVITVLTPARKLVGEPAGSSQQADAVVRQEKKSIDKSMLRNVPANQPAEAGRSDKKLEREIRTNDPVEQVTTNNATSQLATNTDRKASRSVVNQPVVSEAVVAAERRKPQLDKTSQSAIDKPVRKFMTRTLVEKQNQRSGNKRPVNTRSIADNALVLPVTKAVARASETYPVPMGNAPGNRDSNPAEPAVRTADLSATAMADPIADGRWLPALSPAMSLSSVVQQVRPVTEPTPPEVTASAPARQAMPKLSGLSVMLFASPDLSSIGLKNFDRPGTNAGLSIQYQLTDRLSINAGAMYSTKRYQTSASEYVWPSYMNMEVWPDDIAGVCKMIDVPVNVRYDWLLRRRGDGRAPARWFASAGLTSYFIQHEVYNYQFDNPADPKIKYWGWDNQKAGRPGGSFGFSNLNISVGYERPITNRLSWQIEPFMKVPLKQVGYFKVRLLSTGAFVGLRYRL